MIVFFLLFLPLFVCTQQEDVSPMGQYLHTHTKDIIFLMRSDCGIGIPPIELVPASSGTSFSGKCSETLGFMPIGENKVRVLITAGKTIDSKDVEKVSLKYIKPIPPTSANAEQVIALADCNKDGAVTLNNAKSEFNEELKKDDKFYIDDSTIIQCEPFEITVDEKLQKLHGNDPKIKWKMELTGGDGSIINSFDGSLLEENINEVGIRCDPEKLKNTGIPADPEYDIKEVAKSQGEADTVMKTSKDPFTLTRIKIPGSNDIGYTKGYTMVYKVDGKMQPAKKVECKKHGNEFYWKYEVEHQDNTKIEIEREKEIEVMYVRKYCKECKTSASTIPASMDANTTTVIEEVGKDFDKCYVLKTDKCTDGLVYMNSKFKQFSPAVDIVCNKDKKLILDGEEVKSMMCAQQYSAQDADPTKNYVEPNVTNKVETEEPKNCHNLATGCECLSGKKFDFLAVVSLGDKPDWRRVETVIFDPTQNVWNYERTLEIDADGKPIKQKGNLGSRALRCIKAVEKSITLPNKGHPVVFAVNIALICILLLITIPAVILFVNAREKKREAHKAAKANKKKGDKSEDKKDGDKKDEDKKDGEKKNDEKKNEA